MVVVTELVRIPDQEINWTFARSSGPGGQNVNKVASKAVLRWNFATTAAAIPPAAFERMRTRFPGRFTLEGDVVIPSQSFRDQERNREECLRKLIEMIRDALVEPVPRKKTRPTRGSVRRRASDKRRHSEKKRGRRARGDDD